MSTRAKRATEVVRFGLAPRRSVRYLGWLGHDNLGDQAVYEACRATLRGARLVPELPPLRGAAAIIGRRRHAGTVIGGGTLINEAFYLPYAEAALAHTGLMAVLGTGATTTPGGGWTDAVPTRWAHVLRHASYVGVRGPLSAELLSGWGLDAEVLGDPVCHFAGTVAHRPVPGRVGVSVTHGHQRFEGDPRAATDAYVDLVRAAVGDGRRVELLVACEADRRLTMEVVARAGVGDVAVHDLTRDVDAALGVLAGLEAVCGVRLHVLALAACAGVPFVPVAYHVKVRDFLASVGDDRPVLSTADLSGAVLYEALCDAARSDGSRAERIRSMLQTQAERHRAVGRQVLAQLDLR